MRAHGTQFAAWLVGFTLAVGVAAHPAHDDAIVQSRGVQAPGPAAGYGELGFEAPAPGTYRLPPVFDAPDGTVVDTAGQPHQLRDLMGGHTVLLSFIYTSCNDVNGCPLATWVLGRVQAPIVANPALSGRVRLLTLSFDPTRDTPAAMAEYGSRFREKGFDWQFLTTTGSAQLQPLLEGFGQWTLPERDTAGNVTGALAHLLRVYLVDARGRVRNIYNANYLHPDILVNDLLTVLGDTD